MMSKSGFIPVTGGKVFFQTFGDGPKTPIIILRGGPGFSHELLLSLKKLSEDRQVIFYDQLGSGKSDRPKNLSLWTTERFVEELFQVREALELKEVIIYGISWGAMLAVDTFLKDPTGIKALILSNPCLSASAWKKDADRLRLELPAEVNEILLHHERSGTTDHPDYSEATNEYVKRFVCRIDPFPKEVLDAFPDANIDLYGNMWGPSEFCPTGTLKNYERVSDLKKINVPTLVICGRYDEATPETCQMYAKEISGQLFLSLKTPHISLLLKDRTNTSIL